jgi:hypothetical protein
MTCDLHRMLGGVVLAFAVAAAAACGAGDHGSETFDEDGFGISFEHPVSFDEIEDVSIASTAGARSKQSAARGLDERNLILVDRYELGTAVTGSNLARVKPELDRVLSNAADQPLRGTRVEVGGLPGYEYTFDLASRPPVRSRFIVLFDGPTEYTLNCQSTVDLRADVEAACRQAVRTLERT